MSWLWQGGGRVEVEQREVAARWDDGRVKGERVGGAFVTGGGGGLNLCLVLRAISVFAARRQGGGMARVKLGAEAPQRLF